MDEKNEAFQKKIGDKNCGMSSSKFSLIIKVESSPLLTIFISHDKQALIYLSQGSSRGANMIWDNLPRSLTVMAGHYLQLPHQLQFFIKLTFIISFENIPEIHIHYFNP